MNTAPSALLKAATIAAMDAEVRPHSLNPNAIRLRRALGDATGLSQLGVHLITLMPGRESSEYHRHMYEEEFVYILAGEGEALIDDIVHAVGAGDFLGFRRGGAAHVLKNTGTEPLTMLVAGQRLEQDICDYPHVRKRLYVHRDGEDLVDFGAIEPG
ncbi:MAG TPA: cupin domain-containing protein [Dyella sp.]|uniref:cupin domain-containing protein n=1 Tax=Dyella sp. TaxID=1869338 RepID=UPI002F9435CC